MRREGSAGSASPPPQIGEFWSDFKLEMIVLDPDEVEGQQPPGAPNMAPIPRTPNGRAF
jgi:hypothetical protein